MLLQFIYFELLTRYYRFWPMFWYPPPPGIFREGMVTREQGHFDKRFMYDIQRRAPHGKILVLFLQDTLKPAF